MIDLSAMSPAKMEEVINTLPPEERADMLLLLQRYEDAKVKDSCRHDFMAFVNKMWPEFISGRHHRIMANAFNLIRDGKLKRLIINMPPRHTKSEFGSHFLPAWWLGLFPNHKVIQASHTAELSVGFGRKVKNMVNSDDYHEIFPGTSLATDSKASGRWSTNRKGEYFATGVGGALAGRGGNLVIIDDPHSEQQLLVNDPSKIFNEAYTWFTGGPRQRLQPGGAIIIIMCMTGDTPVLMANSAEKPLQDISPGDKVATYDNGKLTTSVVKNHQSNGFDSIYRVRTQSGTIVRANERHPFLVEHDDGVREWVQLKNLKIGMAMVVLPRKDHKKASTVLRKVVISLQSVKDYAHRIITSVTGQQVEAGKAHRPDAQLELSTDTASPWMNTMRWFSGKAERVQSVMNRLAITTLAPTGAASFASTTAMTPERSEGFFATTATLRLDTQKPQTQPWRLPDTSSFTTDRIVEITADGVEEVFDIEIDRTENFIANGVVSHNTRWDERDLTGQILKNAAKQGSLDQWKVIEFPMELPSGKPLWPEYWPAEEMVKLKQDLPTSQWLGQYQQTPTSEEGAIVKREWWKMWPDGKPPPECEFIIQTWDTSFLKTNKSDFNACTTWGVFQHEGEDGKTRANIILLDALNKRMEFPELKKVAFEMYKERSPDSFLIENKAAGMPLIYELRAMGILVDEFKVARGTRNAPNDKTARVNGVSDIVKSGIVWRPNTPWADEVSEAFAAFPNAEHDDLVDASVMALMRFRHGGFITLSTDEEEEPYLPRRRAAYY
jgi:predicted phage terminase large subunit-like protein